MDGRQVRAAIRDAQFKRIDVRSGVIWKWAGVTLAILVIAGLAYLAGSRQATSNPTAEPGNAAPSTAIAPVPSAAAPNTTASALSSGNAPVAAPVAPGRDTTHLEAAASAEKPLTLAERIAATEAWLKTTPDSHFFIQLLIADAGSHREVADFIASNSGNIDLRQVRVYRSSFAGRERLGVIYGDYSSREQANTALAKLAGISPSSRPYVRAVGKLRSPQSPKGPDHKDLT